PPADRPVAPIVTPAYSTEAERDAHGEAERVLNRLGVKPGRRVADVGAGDGYYTVRFAKRLGAGGTIYAEDVTQPYLDRLPAPAGGHPAVPALTSRPRTPQDADERDHPRRRFVTLDGEPSGGETGRHARGREPQLAVHALAESPPIRLPYPDEVVHLHRGGLVLEKAGHDEVVPRAELA